MSLGLFGPERLQYESGGPAREQQVFVFLPDTTTKAVLYADADGLTTAVNPVWTDHLGELTFFAEEGNYDLVANNAIFSVVVPSLGGGDPGGGGGTFEFTQPVPQSVWTVNHNLGYRPHVSVFSIDWGTEYDDFFVHHLNVNQLVISMDQPTAGKALM